MNKSSGWIATQGKVFYVFAFMLFFQVGFGQDEIKHSVARLWNEQLLVAIRNDFARPTIHARNLFHTSIALYDAWAVYDETATTFLLGKVVKGYSNPFNGVATPDDVRRSQEEAMSYAAYRLLKHRFNSAPGGLASLESFDQLMEDLGYDISYTSDDYSFGSPAALGNYIAATLINFGKQDSSNEQNGYANLYYEPVNSPLIPGLPGSQALEDPNRWQPLSFTDFEDQAGFEPGERVPKFLGPEWGKVTPFALKKEDMNIKFRDGNEYWVYHDPGNPAFIQGNGEGLSDEYKWGQSLVVSWSGHLDPTDGVMWDISPASIGNIDEYPTTIEGLRDFYNFRNGGDISKGHVMNPKTGEPYLQQIVPRADYARALAEFWADGPDSETPPGHWFSIFNYVNDHPELEKKYRGVGEVLDDLEWDVKAYFVLGGAVHDAAICAWGIKGWYDYIRPISAIRYMADKGQSTDPDRPAYALDGIPLETGIVDIVSFGDPLMGDNNQHLGKIKLYAWRGPSYINDPENDLAGVGWILAENWWPYQRPNFVTPPFAGYVSGHSTFSRAAAEVLTLFTGDAFFPGGMGEFLAKKNEFLVFEKGPSVDVILQWATYRDASDQTSLSRIWGGIHPPVDDIPGRLIGIEIGHDAFAFAEQYFNGDLVTSIEVEHSLEYKKYLAYPNPVSDGLLKIDLSGWAMRETNVQLLDLYGRTLFKRKFSAASTLILDVGHLIAGTYLMVLSDYHKSISQLIIIQP